MTHRLSLVVVLTTAIDTMTRGSIGSGVQGAEAKLRAGLAASVVEAEAEKALVAAREESEEVALVEKARFGECLDQATERAVRILRRTK